MRQVQPTANDERMVSPAAASTKVRGRICIVTGELAGPDFNGGIGTANRALAFVLRAQGFEVDVLYTHVHEGAPFSARGKFADYVDAYGKVGISLSCIDNPGSWNDWRAKSFLSMRHLLRRRYDLVFFDDTHGTAYYSLLARRTGNRHFRATTMCVTAHSATQWISDLNQEPIKTFEELYLMEMERRSIELADIVKAPSAYILQKYRSYGWTVPDNSIVLPNFILPEKTITQPKKRITVKEIVFFGRLEARKGLWMFCRALDRLKSRLPKNTTVTFLGKTTLEHGISTGEILLGRSAAWPFKIRLLTNFDQAQALGYLKSPGRVAIMPSPEDNSPSAVLECLTEGLPFLACSGSGAEELLDEQTRTVNLFEPSVEGLCTKLLEVLQHGAASGRASLDQAQLKGAFSKWIERLLTVRAESAPGPAKSLVAPRPVLIVVVPADFSAEQAVARLRQAVEFYNQRIEIEVLATDVAKFETLLMACPELPPIKISAYAEYEKIAQSLKYREPTVLALCHISQILPPTWIERARYCFTLDDGISALTGMVAINTGMKTIPGGPLTGILEDHLKIDRYLMGNASSLFPLCQETNSGFVLMRSEVLASFGNIAPVDHRYGRLKRIGDWVHEILLGIHLSGRRFELVPDQAVGQAVQEAPFEIFRLGYFMRSLPQSLLGYLPGTDRALLARLAIDTGLERERSRAIAEYLSPIQQKIGREVFASLPPTSAEQRTQLAMIAHAGGQLELAVDLCARSAIGDTALKLNDFAGFMRSAADSINLIESLANNAYKGLNLDYDFSLNIRPDSRVVELHANSADKGIAALIFPFIDLSQIDHFVSELSVAEAANPVRFRVELISSSRQQSWSSDRVVHGGDVDRWEFECPVVLRQKCRVLIGVEMADPEDASVSAIARWINPHFVRRGRGHQL
jgi:glycosyltransferase involved in cell wall biosynthesis